MKNRSIYAIAGILILILILFLIFSSKPYQWFESMDYEDKNPYDISIIHSVLQETKGEGNFEIIEKDEEISEIIGADSVPEGSNFICFGPKLHTDSSDIKSLLDFADRGNNIYLFSKWFNSDLLDTLFQINKDSMIGDLESMSVKDRDIVDLWIDDDEILWEDNWDDEDWDADDENFPWSSEEVDNSNDSINKVQKEQLNTIKKLFDHTYIHRYLGADQDTICSFNFYSESVHFENDISTIKQFADKTKRKDWAYFNEVVLKYSEAELTKLAYLNDRNTNYLKIISGNGAIYLHSTPLVFTNYNFIKEDFYNYANVALDNLGEGKIFWDESLKTSDMDWSFFDSNESQSVSEGPLAFILSEPSLKWAWYLILIAAFLYLILGVRRKQKAIPVVYGNKNTSIEYAETIGQLFYQKKDHRALIGMKMDQFKSFIQNAYGFRVKFEDEHEKDKMLTKISLHSNVSLEEIKHIFDEFNSSIGSSEVKKTMLVGFHDALEDFYKKCK